MNKHRDIYTRSQVIQCGMASHVRLCMISFKCQICTYIGNNLRANSAYNRKLIGSFAFRKRKRTKLFRD